MNSNRSIHSENILNSGQSILMNRLHGYQLNSFNRLHGDQLNQLESDLGSDDPRDVVSLERDQLEFERWSKDDLYRLHHGFKIYQEYSYL